ncbi:LPXTG cell wall anchor domain-containing protein [Enterococcus sp. 2201sp1_2201st1_B8_2201SCRN_220225]|uniref:LPXTG cell wall anchor domain-containing protein n=1 Tax=unclassified Enterococcus TaxID=2608891 RepID=UPI0034A1F073
MKKIKRKLAVWSSIFLLTSQYGLTIPRVVHAETSDTPLEEVVETTDGSTQGVATKILKTSLKFVGKQGLKLGLLNVEGQASDPMVSSMATAALRVVFPAKMVFREIDQMKKQLQAINDQLGALSHQVDQRFLELGIKDQENEINNKRTIFVNIGERYNELSEKYDAAIEAYRVYGDDPSTANYQNFYDKYVALNDFLSGTDMEKMEGNFNTDLNTLVDLLDPKNNNQGNQTSQNYLYNVQKYAASTMAFRHQSYDFMASSFEELVGYALDYLMTYRTYTTTRIEEQKNLIYNMQKQGDRTSIISKINNLETNYQLASNKLLGAIEAAAEHYLAPIAKDQSTEHDREDRIGMDYSSTNDGKVHDAWLENTDPEEKPNYTTNAVDTDRYLYFYRVKPIGEEANDSQPFGKETSNYYILNHGTGTAEEKKEGYRRLRTYNLWHKKDFDLTILKNNTFFVAADFFNLRRASDTNMGADLLPYIHDYDELFKMESYSFANKNLTKHLTETGELPKNNIVGENDKWLLNYYTEPKQNNRAEIADGKIGLTDTRVIEPGKTYNIASMETDNLSEKEYADEKSDDEPYLVILKNTGVDGVEHYTVKSEGVNAELITIDIADEDINSHNKHHVNSGADVSVKVNLPSAEKGYKNQLTQLVAKYRNGPVYQELYSNQIETAEGATTSVNENFEVPTEYSMTVPYDDTVISAEYETIKESYEVNIEADPVNGYASFSATSYLQGKAEFDEEVEINVSPVEGKVVTGVEITSEDGTKVVANRVAAEESGIPSLGGGVFRFKMPAGNVTVKPLYEAGVIVDLKTDPNTIKAEDVMSFTNLNLWDTNLLNDIFDENNQKIEDTVIRGTFAKEADLHFTAKNAEKYALKSILGDIPGSADDVDIPLEESGKYQHTLPKKVTSSYSLVAQYLDFNNKSDQVKLAKTKGGKVNFEGVPNTVEEMPFTEGETVNINIAPDADWAFDETQLKVTFNGIETEDYQLKQFVDKDDTPKAQLSFKKIAGAVQVDIGFTQENLVYLEDEGGSLRFKESNTNRETYAAGEKIQVKIDPFDKFIKESLQIVAEGKEVVTKDQVSYDGNLLTFTKPDTSAVITVKASFEVENTITKVVEEIGKGQNDFQVLNEKGAEITKAYSRDEVVVSMSSESQEKLVQLLVVGEVSGTKTALDLTKELRFTMPREAIRIEASFDNEQGRDDNHPDQNKDGHYVLKTYEHFLQAGKLMNLPLKDNSYKTATYVLDRIVDFKDQAWQPWGSAEQPFTATLDGKGFGIINLNLQGSALLDTIGEEGVLKNLGILSVKVKEVKTPHFYGGVLAGQNYGIIDNVYLGLAPEITHVRVNDQVSYPREALNQAVMQNGYYFGGVVGKNYGKVMNTTNYLSLQGRSPEDISKPIGGIVGFAYPSSSVVNSTNLGEIDTSKSGSSTSTNGGIVGSDGKGTIVKNNYAHFDIIGSYSDVTPITSGLLGNSTAPLDNYYRGVDYEYKGTPGTKLTSEEMKVNSFKDTLNAGVAANAELKKWNRKDNRNQGLPFMEGGHVFVNQLSQQSLSAGIFTVTSHVPYDTTLELTNLSDKEDTAFFKNAVKAGKIEELVDLSLQHPDGAVKAFKDAEIKVDVSKFEKASENRGFKLLHHTGEKVEEVALKREGNNLVGRVDSLSPFALVSAADEKDIVIDETPTNTEDKTGKGILPKTGEKVTMSLAVVGMILCAGVVVYYFKRRNEKE